jgi:hypothetical protein
MAENAEERAAAIEEWQTAVANIKAMFRQTMAASAPAGESIEQTRVRIAADPATADIAKTLGCTIEELLETFGEPQELLVDESYDHDAACAEAKRCTDIAFEMSGGDVLRRGGARVARQAGVVLTAAHIEAPKRQILGDDANAQLLRRQMQAAANRPAMPFKKRAAGA